MKNSIVAIIVAMVGITCTTVGHYAEWWPLGYEVALIAGYALITE